MSSISPSNVLSGSGIDVDAVVNQMIYAEQAPERLMQSQQSDYSTKLSALSSIASQISTLKTSVDDLKDILGPLATRTATSSNAGVLTATADAGAAISQHTVAVDHLATSSSWYSQTQSSDSAKLQHGSFSLQLGSGTTTIQIDSTNDTLAGLATYLNGKTLGISANVIHDSQGARLSLVSTSTGASNNITITDTSGLTFTRATTAVDSLLTIDGVSLNTASNNVTGVIAGVTLHLMGSGNSSPVTVDVESDNSAAAQAIQTFADNYNKVITAINSQFTYNSSAKQSGPLAGDSALRSVQQTLLSRLTFSTKGNGAVSSLASIGLDMNDDGTLTVDQSSLNSTLANNYAQVQSFFQTSSSAGFADNLDSILQGFIDPLTGILTADQNGMNATQKTLGDQITDFDERMVDRRQQLINQFSQVNAVLEQFPLLQSQITAQLDSLKKS